MEDKKPNKTVAMPKGYTAWIGELKKRYRATQIKAAIAVNSALIEFYWDLGRDISAKYPGKKRNVTFFDTLSRDLQHAIPDADGLSSANIRYAYRFFSLYSYLPQVAEDNDNQGYLQKIAENFARSNNSAASIVQQIRKQ